MTPLLSIITATYNSEATLERTILSVLNQGVSNYEYILVDGSSSDKTISIIKKYEQIFKEKSIAFKWISEPDTGIYNAWNKGLKLASGQWISFLGSDDFYLENALEKYTEIIQENKDKDLIYSQVNLIKNNKIIYTFKDKWIWKKFKKQMKIAHVGAFHNALYFKKYGLFDEQYKIVGDYEMLLRAQANLQTAYLPIITVNMNDGGVSNDNIYAAFREASQAKINTAKTSPFIAKNYAKYALIKHQLITFFRSKLN